MTLRSVLAVCAAILFAVSGGQPVFAQAAQKIVDVNQDVFRGLQYVLRQSPGGRLDAGAMALVARSIVKDGKLDEAERELVDALTRERYSLVIVARKTPTFVPADLMLTGALDGAAKSSLRAGVTPDAIAAEQARQNGPVGGETWADFHLRSGLQGMSKLVDYARQGDAQWAEARTGLAGRYRKAFAEGSWSDGWVNFRTMLSANATQMAGYDPERRDAARLLHVQACIVADIEASGKIPNAAYMQVFSVSRELVDQLLANSGLPPSAIGE